MTSPLAIILSHGYFPKEVPPQFNTEVLRGLRRDGPAVFHLDATKKGSKGNLVSRPTVQRQPQVEQAQGADATDLATAAATRWRAGVSGPAV